MSGDLIQIGRVRSVNPSRRELRIECVAHLPVFDDLDWLYVEVSDAEDAVRCRVAALREWGAGFVATLSPGVARDALVQWRGADVLVPEGVRFEPDEALPPLDELAGMAVVDPSGQTVGVVTTVYEGAANAAITVEQPDGRRMILPLVDAVIERMDLEARVIVVGDTAPYAVEENSSGGRESRQRG